MPAPRPPKPITTPEGLRRLAGKNPAGALANPGLPLVLLAQPDWFARLPEPTLLGLLAVPAEPPNPVLLAAAVAHARPAVRAAAAGHPALRPAHLAALLHDADPAVREAAYQHPRAELPAAELPEAIRTTLLSGLPARAETFEPIWDVRRVVSLPGGWPLAGIAWVAAVPYQPINEGNLLKPLVARLAADLAFRAAAEAAVLPLLAGTLPPTVPPLLRTALATQPDATATLLTTLALDVHPPVREAVARHAATPPAVLTQLAADASEFVRQAVAANPVTPVDTLRQLAADAELRLRIAVARNPSTPPDLLAQLATDPAPDVAQYLVLNPAASLALLTQLAAHPSLRVRLSLQQTGVTLPTELLPALLHNDMAPVAEKARALLARPDLDAALLHQAATASDYRLRLEAAHNPALAPPLVARLLTDSSQQVRQAVAWRTDLSPEQAQALAADELTVQQALARNPAAPPSALALLAASPDWHVRVLLAQHPAAPPATLLALGQDPQSAVAEKARRHPAFPPKELRRLATAGTRPERLDVSRHPGAPAAALRLLAADPDPAIRANVARHPAAPPEAVAPLATDPEPQVQQAWIYNHQPPLAGTVELLRRALPTNRELRLLLQLGYPELLTDADRAALAASEHPADRISVAHQPEFARQLRHDPHLLVRLAAAGEDLM